MRRLNSVAQVIFLVVISLVANQPLAAAGNDPGLWRDLKPQFFLQGSHEPLREGLVSSSAHFIDGSTGWAVGTNGGVLGQSRGMKAHTQDGGKTWEVEFNTVPSEFSGVTFVSRTRGWIVGSEQSSENRSSGVLLETSDGGRSWQKRMIGNFARSGFESIYFSNEQMGYIVGGAEVEGIQRSVIFRTSDGGKDWDAVSIGEQDGLLRDLKFDKSSGVGWAVGDGGEILNSQDDGRTWHKQKTAFDGILLGVAVLNRREVWVAASDKSLLHTIDGGITWKEVSPKVRNKALEDSALWFSGVLFVSKTRGWICGSNGIILNTVDGGKSWRLEAIGKAEFLYKMLFVNGGIIAVGRVTTLLQRNI